MTYVYGNSAWGDLLTKHDGNTVTSDVNGNMTAYGKTKTYTWEHGRELASLTQPAPMAITKQPSDVKGILGSAISFSVTAKGSNLSYKWQVSSNGGSTWADTSANGYNTKTISGFTMTEARDGNMYRCIVTDVSGNVRISDPAEIVLVPIAITKQPSNCYGSVGTPVTFSVTAQGSNLSYQWQVSTNGGSTWGNTSANGANTNTISGFDITEARDGNMYRCVITDGDGNTVTSSAKSIIATDLAITKQPGTFKGLLGDTVTLSVNAYGSSLTYRWQVSTDGGETWSNSSATGYNTKTISGFELTEARNGNMYRCIVTDGDGNTVTSNAGKISVITETWTYTYDADGLRTKATNGHNTYEYTYDGGKLTSMKVDDKVLYFFYDGNGKPWYFLYNNTKYFYATNLQGDVTAIMTVSGSTKVKYTYDAWGNILSITGANAATIGKLNPLRYRGYVYDQPTGLYYLQSRYYDPNLGRFINADIYTSTGQGLLGNNMFAYCRNNPVCRKDASGTEDECATDINEDNNPLNDIGNPSGSGSGGCGNGGDSSNGSFKSGNGGQKTNPNPNPSTPPQSDGNGWKVGQDISKPTRAGNDPSWSTVRQRYWKNEAHYNHEQYSYENLELMRKGRAPKDAFGYPMELHHPYGRSGGNFFIFGPVTHANHLKIHYGG